MSGFKFCNFLFNNELTPVLELSNFDRKDSFQISFVKEEPPPLTEEEVLSLFTKETLMILLQQLNVTVH
jgi:hypothetical protein